MTENLGGVCPAPEPGEFDGSAPENVAPLVVWLGSPESRGVTGQVFLVGGGRIGVARGWQGPGGRQGRPLGARGAVRDRSRARSRGPAHLGVTNRWRLSGVRMCRISSLRNASWRRSGRVARIVRCPRVRGGQRWPDETGLLRRDPLQRRRASRGRQRIVVHRLYRSGPERTARRALLVRFPAGSRWPGVDVHEQPARGGVRRRRRLPGLTDEDSVHGPGYVPAPRCRDAPLDRHRRATCSCITPKAEPRGDPTT